jgi:hypothetical protein
MGSNPIGVTNNKVMTKGEARKEANNRLEYLELQFFKNVAYDNRLNILSAVTSCITWCDFLPSLIKRRRKEYDSLIGVLPEHLQRWS